MVASPEEMSTLRKVLDDAGYTDRNLIGKLGAIELPTRKAGNRPRLLRMTNGGTPQETLIRLFLFGAPVDVAAARAALHPLRLESLYRMGIVESRGSEAVSRVALCPYGKYVLAFDRPEQVSAGARPDLVMGITSSTMDLVHFTVRERVRAALDLGTGCGMQAFLAAEHADLVFGVDRCARAAAFARFNIALNGLENVECLEGDRFEPVAGRRFGLVVGNLPFVIAPATRYLYRDNGMELDRFTRSVVEQVPAYLEEGGFCQLICEWVHPAGEDPAGRLAGWFRDAGCDVWVLRLSTAKPALYAEAWIRDTEPDDPAEFDRLYGEWTCYYERHKVEAISTGLIAMRRAPGRANWFHMEETSDHVPEHFGEQVLRAFAARDFLRDANSDEALLAARLSVAQDVHLMADNQWTPEGWRVTQARLTHASGLRQAGDINNHMAQLLARCDGRRTVRDAAADYAATLGVEWQRVATPCLPVVRELIAGGFLVAGETQLVSNH